MDAFNHCQLMRFPAAASWYNMNSLRATGQPEVDACKHCQRHAILSDWQPVQHVEHESSRAGGVQLTVGWSSTHGCLSGSWWLHSTLCLSGAVRQGPTTPHVVHKTWFPSADAWKTRTAGYSRCGRIQALPTHALPSCSQLVQHEQHESNRTARGGRIQALPTHALPSCSQLVQHEQHMTAIGQPEAEAFKRCQRMRFPAAASWYYMNSMRAAKEPEADEFKHCQLMRFLAAASWYCMNSMRAAKEPEVDEFKHCQLMRFPAAASWYNINSLRATGQPEADACKHCQRHVILSDWQPAQHVEHESSRAGGVQLTVGWSSTHGAFLACGGCTAHYACQAQSGRGQRRRTLSTRHASKLRTLGKHEEQGTQMRTHSSTANACASQLQPAGTA